MNYPELRAAIARAGAAYSGLSLYLGISKQAFYNKLQGQSEFRCSEIQKLAGALGLSLEEVNLIFFDNALPCVCR